MKLPNHIARLFAATPPCSKRFSAAPVNLLGAVRLVSDQIEDAEARLPTLAIKQGFAGTLRLVAKAVKGGKSNEWQYSTDAGTTWVNIPPSPKPKTTVTGLQPGIVTLFRHRTVTRAGPRAWSRTISATLT